MAALVRHFGDVEDAEPRVRQMRCVRSGGRGAEAVSARDGREEQRMVQAIVDELRAVDLQGSGHAAAQASIRTGSMSRDEFEGLLDAMTRSG